MKIAVISPFLDNKHGTERCVIELLERLVRDYRCQVHLYSQRVEDLTVEPANEMPIAERPGIWWHRVPSIRGPHLLQYVWWFATNTILRWWHSRSGKLPAHVVFSPGINAWDAEVVHVHIVFEEFYRRVRNQLRFRGNPPSSWPLLLHRRLYYGLVRWLERQIYPREQLQLAGVSGMVCDQLATYFQRRDAKRIPNGVNLKHFSPAIRMQRRSPARLGLGILPTTFVFLLIGNDWRKKGLHFAIEAFGKCSELPIRLLVVGRDQAQPFATRMNALNISEKITFLAPSDDIMNFYAASDAYLGPSLEDAFGLPVLEAMACGLPVITSANAGVSELIEDGLNGLLLRNTGDIAELATLLRRVVTDSGLREVLATNALKTVERCTWDESAAALWKLLNQPLGVKRTILG